MDMKQNLLKVALLITVLLYLGTAFAIQINLGEGTASNSTTGSPTPYGTWYKNFRQQYLIQADELFDLGAGAGLISSLDFNVASVNSCSPMPDFTIKMKHTAQTGLSSSFETGTYTEVFYQNDYLPTAGWNSHIFSQPFNWDGSSNIIVEIVTSLIPGDYTQNASVYYTGTAFTSSLRYHSDSNAAAASTTGITSTNRANMRLEMEALNLTDPPNAANLINPEDGASSLPLNVNLEWSGSGFVEGYKLNLGTNNPPSNILNNVDLGAATEYNAGSLLSAGMSYYWQVIPYNEIGAAPDCPVWSFSTSSSAQITVGDGSQLARVPMDFYYKNSLFETIFSADELSNVYGMITGLMFYNDFNTDLTDMPVKIWLGTTAQTDLSSGWIPAGDLTLVFDGTVDFPSGENAIYIALAEPFLYLDGDNLVMMVNRPMDSQWYNSGDRFLASTMGETRSRNMYNDNTEFVPSNPSGGTLSGQIPMTTFFINPGGVGHISGIVQEDGTPLEDVLVLLNDGMQSIQTGADGSFLFSNLLPDLYDLSFSKHAYLNQNVQVEVEEDITEELTIDLQAMLRVELSGSVVTSDSMQGIQGATIHLSGYEDYQTESLADGSIILAEVVANQTYSYSITHPGYSSIYAQVEIGEQDYSLGTVIMNELAFAPHSLQAELNADQNSVDLTWGEPNTETIGFDESFEDAQFPPVDWSQIITNSGGALANGAMPTWDRYQQIVSGSTVATPADGQYQAGLWWDYEHQDEWLITPDFLCPSDALLSFESFVYRGSEHGDNYYVKISAEGSQDWQTLWNASAQTGEWNEYDAPIIIDLSAYYGQQIKLAFHAEDPPTDDGLWYQWFIDAIEVSSAIRSETRSLTGYKLWRLNSGQEANEAAWVALNGSPETALEYTDNAWGSVESGDYRWAVKAAYSNDVYSSASYSNIISKGSSNPLPPQDLTITTQGSSVLLAWDQVEEDVNGNPVTIDFYEVHLLETADVTPSPYTVFATTSDTSLLIEDILLYMESSFFCVKAVSPAGFTAQNQESDTLFEPDPQK
jgi:hypothetical protein